MSCPEKRGRPKVQDVQRLVLDLLGFMASARLRSVAPVIGILLDAEEVSTILRKEAQNGT